MIFSAQLYIDLSFVVSYGYARFTLFKRLGIKGLTAWPFIGMYFKYKTVSSFSVLFDLNTCSYTSDIVFTPFLLQGLLEFYTECHEKYRKVWG